MAEKLTHPILKPLSRRQYLDLVQAGLKLKQYTFVRQAALNWLGIYPGDLKMGLIYAQSLAGDGHYGLAFKVAQGLAAADPEYLEAVNLGVDVVRLLVQNQENSTTPGLTSALPEPAQKPKTQYFSLEKDLLAHQFALSGNSRKEEITASWGAPLWIARQAAEHSDLSLAEQLIEEIIHQGVEQPLLGVLHMQIISQKEDLDLSKKLALAETYRQRFPDTLQIMLHYAQLLLQAGRSDQAVTLLHQAASRDIAGQVIKRMWNERHPYQTLWPDSFQSRVNLMVPGVIMAVLGWNRLPASIEPETTSTPARPVVKLTDKDLRPAVPAADKEYDWVLSDEVEPVSSSAGSMPVITRQSTQSVLEPAPSAQRPDAAADVELQRVELDLEKAAKHCKASGITRQDGRFPVYVMYSARERLRTVYGADAAALIETEMIQLASALQKRPGWAGKTFFADDPDNMRMYGITAAKNLDAWSHKLLLADLDNALARNGERIGALLIVGGAEIIPFHLLPNPVEDSDQEVPSDNPYATRDKNYFLSEWPVGRLPGGAGSDASLILKALRRFSKMHLEFQRRKPWHQKVGIWLKSVGNLLQPASRNNFGYSAEIWRQAAGNVFRVIGRPATMHISPPSGLMMVPGEGEVKKAQGLNGIPVPFGKLAYYNLHGVADAVEWFGHRDLLSGSGGPDFPIALRPEDILARSVKGRFPEVVFSEACYGMSVQNTSAEASIALNFLEAGSQAVVGATCMSYGALTSATLLAADLLGHTFWRFLKNGMPAGEALRQAKIYLVTEMQKQQGYLDSEDQKTVISFVLFGDPLAQPFPLTRVPKSIRFQASPINQIRTISDCLDDSQDEGPVPPEIMKGVQRAVAKYLPGMKDARLDYVCETSSSLENNPVSANSKSHGKSFTKKNTEKNKPGGLLNRNLVMLSKSIARQGEIHPIFARLTLDDRGRLVKLVVSR